MSKAIFPGSFDPVTLGHIDIIERSAKLFDEVIVCILHNSEKQSYFTLEQRLAFLRSACAHIPNVRCTSAQGLSVSFAKKQGAKAMIRGVRSIKDYEYEQDIASINHHIASDIETVCLFSKPQYAFVSSSMIKEMVQYKQDVRCFVSEEVAIALQQKIS